jgi:hypothetical protein
MATSEKTSPDYGLPAKELVITCCVTADHTRPNKVRPEFRDSTSHVPVPTSANPTAIPTNNASTTAAEGGAALEASAIPSDYHQPPRTRTLLSDRRIPVIPSRIYSPWNFDNSATPD